MSTNAVRVVAMPEKGTLPGVRVVAAPTNGWIEYVALSDQVVFVETHWGDHGCFPCIGEDKGCQGCAKGMGVRVKGYLGSLEPKWHKRVIVEVTLDAALNCDWVLGEHGPCLRGQTFRIDREKPGKRSRVRISFANTRLVSTVDQLPRLDVLAHLCAVWRIAYNKPGNPN